MQNHILASFLVFSMDLYREVLIILHAADSDAAKCFHYLI